VIILANIMPYSYLCGVNHLFSFIHHSSFIMANQTVAQKKLTSAIKEKANLQQNAVDAQVEKTYFESELATENAKATPSPVIVKMLTAEIASRQSRIDNEVTVSPEYDAYIALLV
jgi:hypothetical protein